jgi:nitric oxide synthase oxygenase domain/subunit
MLQNELKPLNQLFDMLLVSIVRRYKSSGEITTKLETRSFVVLLGFERWSWLVPPISLLTTPPGVHSSQDFTGVK